MSGQYGPEFDEYCEHVRKEVLPKVIESGVFISITPANPKELDIKFAVELGMAVMLDKPIIAIIRPGTKIPEKLARVVEHFVECDNGVEDTGFQERLKNTITAFMNSREKTDE